MNRVQLSGNITKDLEVSYTQTGKACARFTVATNEKVNVDGQEKEIATFHNCVAWGFNAEKASSLLKGSHVYVEGKLQNRSWEDKDGNKRYITEVMVYAIFKGIKPEQNSSNFNVFKENTDNFQQADIPF